MSSAPALVLKNFIWHLEAIVPSKAMIPQRFRHYDPFKEEPQDSTGWARRFFVEWMDSDADTAATNASQREAWHVYRVYVDYPARWPLADLLALMLDDRADIVKTLRAQGAGLDNRMGYDDAHPQSDTGLCHRVRSGDERNTDNETVWRYVSEWRCKIRELET